MIAKIARLSPQDYLSLVPLKDFTADMLYPLPLDHGPLFTQYCAYHYLYMKLVHYGLF